ncbi:MAG TPA: TolC family protein [Bryobacteraceae bacterium]|nr:TolC family protein [Bryobacteraceae bacterium]
MLVTRFAIVLTCSFALCAHEQLEVPRFPQTRYFKRHFFERPAAPSVQPPARVAELLVDGTLELSMRSYLEVVLSNNTEIQIQKSSIEPLRNAITRALAPFDPSVSASFQANRSTTPSYSALEGAERLSQLRQPLRFSFQQTLQNGTQFIAGFEGSKSSTNNRFATFNPALNANMTLGFTAPLLRNRGRRVNLLPVLIARTQYEGSRFTVESQLNRIVEEAQDAYWTVVEARENLRVQVRSLESLAAVIKRHEREVELGEMAPVDIHQSEQAYASRELALTEARYRLRQAQDTLRRTMGIDLDPALQHIPIELTESLASLEVPDINADHWIKVALERRPDLKAGTMALEVDDLLFRQSQNALLPEVSLNATYTSSGRGGHLLQRTDYFAPDGTVGEVVRTIPGGLGDAVGQVLGFGFPTYSFGIGVRLPLRDRRAAADLADANAAKRLDTLRLRSIQQQIRLEVLNAVNRVERSRDGIRLAEKSVDIAAKRLEAERRKYARGVTTIFLLLDAENSLTRAEADLVERSVRYQRDLGRLLAASAMSLSKVGIVVQ